MAQHKGYLSLTGLTTLSDEAAKALAKHEGDLRLNGLASISDEAFKALQANSQIVLPKQFNRVQKSERKQAIKGSVSQPAKPHTAPEAAEWHVANNGGQSGAYTTQQVRDMIEKGQLPADGIVWKPGMTGWILSAECPEFADMFVIPSPLGQS